MMRKFVIYILIALCTLSCARRPEGVLSRSRMVDVLVDLHRTDGIVYVKGFQYGHEDEASALYMLTLEKYGITQAQFDSSLVWYTDHPVYFNLIYPKVLSRLEKERDALSEMNKASAKSPMPSSRQLPPLEKVLGDMRHAYLGHWSSPAPAPAIYIYGVLVEEQQIVRDEMERRRAAAL